MSIHDAKVRLERAFKKASEEIGSEIDSLLRSIKDQAVYTPSKGDVISLTYDKVDYGQRTMFIVFDVRLELSYGPWFDVSSLLTSRKIRFAADSEVGRSVLFLRRATPAEMAQVGLTEKDVEPAKPDDLDNYTGPIFAEINKAGHPFQVRVSFAGSYQHSIEVTDGLNSTWVATASDRETAIKIANKLYGNGHELNWKKFF